MATIDDMLSDLLSRNAGLFSAYETWANGQTKLLSGTVDDPNSFNATGGKTGALGYYPVTNVSGQTVYVPSLARLNATAQGAVDPSVIENLLGASIGTVQAAASAATGAAAQATSKAQLAIDAANAATGAVNDAIARLVAMIPPSVFLFDISAFYANPAQAEIGSSVASVDLAWTINKPVAIQTVDGVTISPDQRSSTRQGPFNTDHKFTLYAEDGSEPAPWVASATIQLKFLAKWYAFTAATPNPSDADLISASLSGFATERTRTIAFGGGGFPTYAWPVALGMISTLEVGSFEFTNFTVIQRDLVNASGATVPMYVLVFNVWQNGALEGKFR